MNLHDVVQELAATIPWQKEYPRKNVQIFNEVHRGLPIVAEQEILSQALKSLLTLASNHSQQYYISVSAKLFNKLVLVQLKTNIEIDNSQTEQTLRVINDMAGAIGGCLYISSDRKDEKTITYTYINKPGKSGKSITGRKFYS
ncbi:hypothetical protein [Terrimonas pollutisoli]|uniref:hypothetical protein n=1 Tax=Terrimonas pollutisoli TaxID=3034147 RepID=UPI0023EDD0EB|nr:hypothetical protein [Terrimonas sp. H1YJ31]